MKRPYKSSNGYEILIDYSMDSIIGELGLSSLKDRYMLPEETSPQEAFARASCAFAENNDHAQRLYNYASKQWFMFSTPILSNGGTNRGMPISCFLNYVKDSLDGIKDHYVENIGLASGGGGIAGYWGALRSMGTKTSTGNKTTGVIPFVKVVDSLMQAFNQGATRRGSYAAYLPVSHPEIFEFLEMRKPSGGDINRKSLNLHHGVCIDDDFMKAVKGDYIYSLRDPHTGESTPEMARDIWMKILETRAATGEPYLYFTDTVERKRPDNYHFPVPHSNLCTEITLSSDETKTAICCLSSVNLEKYDEWENDTNFIYDLILMLVNVTKYFIDNTKDMKAKKGAEEYNLGLGAMGFHSYLQSKDIPMESLEAYLRNVGMFSFIAKEAQKAAETIRSDKNLPSNTLLHLTAIAPNASSSIICGNVSPSIEPYRANAFVQKTLSGSYLFKNKYLQEHLKAVGLDTDDTWQSIVSSKGSVQHIEELGSVREIFKTAVEIDQKVLVRLAYVRQRHIHQAQSLNLFFPPDVSKMELHDVHWSAWEGGLKTLYYLRSEAIHRSEIIGNKVEVTTRKEVEENDCVFCEG